jgi:hypothetical protein
VQPKINFRQKKIEKLKSGSNSKHVFSDQDYLRKRDTVLDEVEDAVEAGHIIASAAKQKIYSKLNLF